MGRTQGARGWHEVSRRLLDTVFPPHCAGCRVRGHWLCPHCLSRVDTLTLPICSVCRRPLDPTMPHGCNAKAAPIRTISAAGAYTGPLRDAVHALKYEGRHGIAATLADLLYPRVDTRLQEGDLLIPIPLHPTRERERGYNQAAILARELARLVPCVTATNALRRVRATADQTTLTGVQRRENMRGAFAARPDIVRGCRVWLLDDVCTTGATLRAGAQAVRSAGASEVHGIVVAMTL